MAALFGGNRSRNAAGGGNPKALVEFRAGKMTLKDSLVTPDKRKGLVSVENEESLMHFKWKDRSTGLVEDDLIIFPDDVEFKHVPQCKTGRVYILKFKSTNKKMFFWLQEPKTDKDQEYCDKVNEYLNNPSAARSAAAENSSSGGSSGGGGLPGFPALDLNNLQDTELQNLLSNMSQQQLMQLLGGGGASTLANLIGGGSGGSPSSRSGSSRSNRTPARTNVVTAGSSAETPASSGGSAPTPAAPTKDTSKAPSKDGSKAPIQLEDLQSILSGIQVPGGAGGSNEPNVDLSSSINAEVLQPLLGNPDFVKKMKEFLPKDAADGDKKKEEGGSSAEEIKSNVQSPQFQQALSMFSAALQSGQLAPLIQEFNLGDKAVAAAAAGNMENFIKALQEESKKSVVDKPEDMALD